MLLWYVWGLSIHSNFPRKWRDGPYATASFPLMAWRLSLGDVSLATMLPGTSLVTVQWWKHDFLLKLCKNPEISPLVLETFTCYHCFSAFWQWFPIIWCRFQVYLSQNQGAFIGRTKSEKSLVKLIVWRDIPKYMAGIHLGISSVWKFEIVLQLSKHTCSFYHWSG